MKRYEQIATDLQARLATILSQEKALPPVRKLADQYGASQKTICGALEILVNKGLLLRLGGRAGYRAPGSAVTFEKESHPPRFQKAWQDIADEIKRKLLIDALDNESSLPTASVLCAQFGCSYRTLRKALAYLATKGFLVRRGRTYARAALQKQSIGAKHNYIIIDQRYDSKENVTINSILQTVDIAFRLAGWHSPEIVTDDAINAKKMDACGACICISREPHQWFRKFLQAYPRPPKACIDLSQQHGDIQVGDPRKLMIIAPDNLQCGLNVAHYLKDLGHSRIAVFSDGKIDRLLWRALRVAGIGEIFPYDKRGDRSAALFEPKSDSFASEADLRSAASAFSQAVNALSGGLGSFLRTRLKMLEDIRYYCKRYVSLAPQFSKALEDQSITAWIGTIDEVALPALVFLHENRIETPGRISVLGFDNTPDAAQAGMTSYEIGTFDMARTAFQWLRSPGLVKGRCFANGALFERLSTAKPRKS